MSGARTACPLPGQGLVVAILFPDLSISGGTQRQGLMLARTLLELGWTVRCYAFAFDPERCYPEIHRPLPVTALPRDWEPPPARYWLRSGGERSQKHHRVERARALAELAVAGRPDVVNLHDFQVFEAAAFVPPGPAVVWMLNDVPLGVSFRVPRAGERMSAWETVRARCFPRHRLRLTRRRALARIDRMVVLDRGNQRRARDLFGRDAEVVRSGVSLVEAPPDREAPTRDSPLRLLSVGILHRHRRFEDLIRATALLHQQGLGPTLKIVGRPDTDPAYAAELRRLVGELGLGDRVTFLDEVSDDTLDALYREAHVFVFPHAPQSWGLSPFEAMARGTPVVLTTGCGASEVVTDGAEALVTAPFDPQALAAAIARLADDPDLWRGTRRRALRFVRENLSWPRYAESMERVFRRGLEASAGTGAPAPAVPVAGERRPA